MNKEAINKQIQELEAKVAELKAQVNKPEKDEWPKFGYNYFFIGSAGTIEFSTFSNNCYDFGRISIGNMFRTREETQRRIEQLKLIQELREFGGDNGEWHIWYGPISKDWQISIGYSGFPQFPSQEKALEAIEHFGDRLNILLPSND